MGVYEREMKAMKDVIERTNVPTAASTTKAKEENKDNGQGMFSSSSGVHQPENSDATSQLVSCEQLRHYIYGYMNSANKDGFIYEAIAKIGAIESMIKMDDERIRLLMAENSNQIELLKGDECKVLVLT